MFLTKIFYVVWIGYFAGHAESAFEDFPVGVCSAPKREIDPAGKFWPRYCHKFPEGEFEVVFMREYCGEGWKYVVSDHSLFEGRLRLDIKPCGANEIDGQGREWIKWCFSDKEVEFEKSGTVESAYLQDFKAGYSLLQFRRIANNEIFDKIWISQDKNLDGIKIESYKGNETTENHEKISIDIRSSYEKLDIVNEDFNSGSQNLSQDDLSSVATNYSKSSEDPQSNTNSSTVNLISDPETSALDSSHSGPRSKKIKSHPKKSLKITIKVKNEIPSQKSHKKHKIDYAQHPEIPSEITSDSLHSSESNLILESTNILNFPNKQEIQITQIGLKTINEIAPQNIEPNPSVTYDSEGNIFDPDLFPIYPPVILSPNESESGSPIKPKIPSEVCGEVEDDRSGRYFYVEYSSEGNQIEYDFDRNKNFVYDPIKKSRIDSKFLSQVPVLFNYGSPCPVFNSQGILLELEKDSFVENLFWEILYEDGVRVKYVRSRSNYEKQYGMYAIDSETGYRFRSFI